MFPHFEAFATVGADVNILAAFHQLAAEMFVVFVMPDFFE
jgi:hypothetical protein